MSINAYEGADSGIRLAQKGLLTGSADTLAAREIEFLRRRSHHLCRNNPLAVTARNRLVSHWIGSGIKVKWSNSVVQKEWDAFAKSPSIDGWGDIYSLQNLWGLGFFESGEIFTRMVIREVPGRKVPLLLQTFETEQLDILYRPDLTTRYGITFNDDGKPTAYNFWKRFPNEWQTAEQNVRVPLDARDILHIFQRERPGQWRGIPKLAPVLLPLYEMDELLDATLVRQKAAQAIGWIVEKVNPGALPLIGNIESGYQETDETEAEIKDKRLQKIKPGGIHYLQPDEKFVFATTEDIGANLTVLLQYQTRLCAATLDLTYEQLTGDLTGVNFSSIRAGTIEIKKKIANTQQLIFITQALRPLTERFKELGGIYASNSFEKATCKFILPRTDWVDPLKDIQADLLEVRAGFATLAEKLGERGIEDVEAHIKQLMTEQGYDIILESNPEHNLLDSTVKPIPTAPSSRKQTERKNK